MISWWQSRKSEHAGFDLRRTANAARQNDESE
jgi:hypothetical protein